MVKMMIKKINSTILILLVILLPIFISCDYQHGLHPVKITGISGTVTFVGDWPEDTEWVRIFCFQQKPKSENVTDILVSLFDAKIGNPVPPHATDYNFTVELEPGVYRWIAVIYNSNTFPLKIIGEYDQSDLIVEKGKIVDDVNITADFNQLNNL